MDHHGAGAFQMESHRNWNIPIYTTLQLPKSCTTWFSTPHRFLPPVAKVCMIVTSSTSGDNGDNYASHELRNTWFLNSPGRCLVSLPAWCGTYQGHCDGQGSAGPIVARRLSLRKFIGFHRKIPSHGGFYQWTGLRENLMVKTMVSCRFSHKKNWAKSPMAMFEKTGISAIHRMESEWTFNSRFFFVYDDHAIFFHFFIFHMFPHFSTCFHIFPHFFHMFPHVSHIFPHFSNVQTVDDLRTPWDRQVPAIVWRFTAPRASQSRQIGCPGWMRPGELSHVALWWK